MIDAGLFWIRTVKTRLVNVLLGTLDVLGFKATVGLFDLKLDGFVLARSLFSHSANYRSVVVFGKAEIVEDPDEINRGLKAITESTVPGRWDEARHPNPDELHQTLLVKLSLAEASAKIRTGPPGDDPEDVALDVWAGVIPLETVLGEPIPAPDLRPGLPLPAMVAKRT